MNPIFPCIYKPGDLVSLERWDRSERPANKKGSPGRVTEIGTTQNCESGYMVRGISDKGTKFFLDANWLEPWKHRDLYEI